MNTYHFFFNIFYLKYDYNLYNIILFNFPGISFGGVVGGFLYQTYGGKRTFKLFSYGSLIMGILHVIFIKFTIKSN